MAPRQLPEVAYNTSKASSHPHVQRVRVLYLASGSVHFSAIVHTSTYECEATPNYVNCYVNCWVCLSN